MSFTNLVTNGFGRVEIFTDGKLSGSIGASPFANMTEIRDASGSLIGQDQIDGFGNTQHFDENLAWEGFSRPNFQGGFDNYNHEGFITSTVDSTAGFSVHGSEGLVGNIVGDVDAGDDVINSFMNHF